MSNPIDPGDEEEDIDYSRAARDFQRWQQDTANKPPPPAPKVRKPPPPRMCPSCNTANDVANDFCRQCAYKLKH